MGQIVKEFSTQNDSVAKIHLENLTTGVYFVKSKENNLLSKTFIINP